MKDYREHYKQALERAKHYLSELELGDTARCVFEEIFPELKESEDESIRKEIIQFLQLPHPQFVGKRNQEEWISWLEEQGKENIEGTFVNVDDVRDDFMSEVYRVLDADSTNDRANQIINAFDSLPTVVIKKQGSISPTEDELEALRIAAYEPTKNWSEKLQSLYEKLVRCEQKASIDFSDLKTWKYIVDAVLTKEHGIGQYLDNESTEIIAKELQERFGNIMQNPAWSEEHISVIERDGEKWVRVCAFGEDFIIAAHDYTDGDKTEFTWEEACKIGTFSKKQAYIILALLGEINAKLREIGGEPLSSYSWSSSEYNQYNAWFVNFHSGYVNLNAKYYSGVARAVIAF